MILATSIPQRGEISNLRNLGYAGYLTKPVRLGNLQHMLSLVAGFQAGSPCGLPLLTEKNIPVRPNPGYRVLIAEDNTVNQRVATRLLEKAGYTCDVVCNGQEAVAAVQQCPYDCILMDCQMPILDGFEASMQIRGLGMDLVIVAATAGVTVDERRRCHESGMNDFVAKPIQAASLLDILEKQLLGRVPRFSCRTLELSV